MVFHVAQSGKGEKSIRFIRTQRKNPNGTYANPTDNADAFWVIE